MNVLEKIYINFLFFLKGWTCGIRKFLGWGQIGVVAPSLQHSHSNAGLSHICDLCCSCSNAGSLTHWAMPGIEPMSSETLCWVLNLLSHNWNSLIWGLYLKPHPRWSEPGSPFSLSLHDFELRPCSPGTRKVSKYVTLHGGYALDLDLLHVPERVIYGWGSKLPIHIR